MNISAQFSIAPPLAVLILLLCTPSGFAFGNPPIKEISKRTVSMTPVANCTLNGVCDLKSVKMVERKVKVLVAGERADFATYMTDFRFIVEVAAPENITNYGIVQFMRGCMYESMLLPDGTETRDFSYVHKHFGKWSLIRHVDWVVDSSHSDPLATAFEGYGRFDLYKWNSNPNDLDADNANWYFDAKPSHGTVFKADLVANTGLVEGATIPTARNSSVEFETCLFKSSDVPLISDSTGRGVDKAKAIWCSNWDHKFRYDFNAGHVVQETAIHPFCATASTGPL